MMATTKRTSIVLVVLGSIGAIGLAMWLVAVFAALIGE